MLHIDTTTIEYVDQQLRSLPRRETTFDFLKQLAPAIEDARKRGQDFQAIAKVLTNAGVKISPNTLRRYMQVILRETEDSSDAPCSTQAHSSEESTLAAPPPLTMEHDDNRVTKPIKHRRNR